MDPIKQLQKNYEDLTVAPLLSLLTNVTIL